MIKLKLRHLNSEVFQNAVIKLTKSGKFKDFKSSYNMAKLARKLWNETRVATETFRDQMQDYFEKDSEGKLVRATPEQTKITGALWKIKEDKVQDYLAALDKILDTDIEIECHPVNPEMIDVAAITPQEVAALEAIFSKEELASPPQS